MRQIRAWIIVLAAAGYVLAGTGTALLARHAASPSAVTAWRLAAWFLSLAIFGLHFTVERGSHTRRLSVAGRVALGVALGALGVAAAGPLRAHWADWPRMKLVLLSLVAWPVLTGVPAFVVALIGGFVVDRWSARRQRSRAGVV